jgi:hypothetical protein
MRITPIAIGHPPIAILMRITPIAMPHIATHRSRQVDGNFGIPGVWVIGCDA